MTSSRIFTAAVLFASLTPFAGAAFAAPKSTSPETIGEYLHAARRERGFVCYSDHYHYGSSSAQSSKKAAEAAAISSWSSFVDFEYGSAWASYSKSGSKKMTCSQSTSGWDCSVEARPCRS